MNQTIEDDHSRTIIHIDIDCFYAQVETLKNPALAQAPLGIQQKNIVVTSNYLAREYGVKKCMFVSDAQKLCPNLVLVNGEDLHDYRQVSYKLTEHLQVHFSTLVERLGLDENFIDVTSLVSQRIGTCGYNEVVGHVYGSYFSEKCECGCEGRLKIGARIAKEIRDSISAKFKLTCTAGIAHNKLLAKLVGSTHKPNQQTVIFPKSAMELLLGLKSFRDIPGIGTATAEILNNLNIHTIVDLQNCDEQRLKTAVGALKAKFLCDICYGIDTSAVKPSGKPQSIGLEDSCKTISAEADIKEKLTTLLQRLIILIKEDGRTPRTVKLTIRKFDKANKTSHRETRQCNISPSLFAFRDSDGKMTESSEAKLISMVMHLFEKMVDTSKPYHITLLGLSCTKFQEPAKKSNSLTSFLRRDIEVQSMTNIESKRGQQMSPMEGDFKQNNSGPSDIDSESEPSPKKIKFVSLLSRRRCFRDNSECVSPSKLSVADLRLNSTEKQDKDTNQNILCPPNADKEVFRELPLDVQRELWEDYKRDRDRNSQSCCSSETKKAKPNTLFNYFVKH